MRIEIVVFAALAALASAAPQWPYRDAVAPYYYGYPGKTPYMYRSGDEDDERDETFSLARQDLKVASTDGGSTTVVEDDEKADGVHVVETGSAKPLKPVVQSANNNQQQQEQQQPAAASQAQQPLGTNNAQQQIVGNGQPLTVQQPGQQPPAFPPARPTNRPRPAEEEDEEEEDEDSEEDDEDAEDDEDDGDDDDDDDEEEDDEDRRRDNIAQKEASSEEPAQQQPAVVQPEEPQASIPTSEGSDEVVEAEPQPVVVEQPQRLPSQSSVLSNKVIKNKQSVAAVASVPVVPGKSKKKAITSKVKPNSGAIEALVPGYVTDQGEVLVPVDTVTGSQPITIVPDPFSPPSRIVGGPRPIPRGSIPNTPSRQVPYWYRSSPVINPLTQDIGPMSRQTLYTSVPPPGSIFTFDDDDDDDDADDSPAIIPGNRLRQESDDDDGDEEADEDEEEDDRKKKAQPQKVPLAAVPAVGNSGEDDEAEALAFINKGRPVQGTRPAQGQSSPAGNKKPGPGGKPTGQATSNESDSEEDVESEEDEVSNEDEEEEDDSAAARAVGASPAQIAASPLNRGRMYVDEEFVSFPPSRSPTVFAVIQGRYPGSGPQRRQQSQIITAPNPGNPYQRFVVRVTPSNGQPRPPTSSPLYYRPLESRPPPNRRVVPVASFDVSVEDTRPSSLSNEVDSEEDTESISVGGPTPVNNYPFVYKVQGSVQGLRVPGGGQSQQTLQSLAALLGGRPPRPSYSYYGASEGPGHGPSSRPKRPGPPGPYGYRPRPSYSFSSSFYGSPYGPPGPRPSASHSYGPPRPSGPGGPPVIVRRKQPGGGPNRPPKPHLIAVYNPTGSSSGPRPREPVDEEYYTFEVPEHNNKIISSGGPPKNNKRPTVHRKPTPVIHQKHSEAEDEEPSDEQSPGESPQKFQIIPQGSVRTRSRRIRGGKQLKPKKNSKKTVSSSKKQQQQDQQDPLGLLSKINKSKTKMH